LNFITTLRPVLLPKKITIGAPLIVIILFIDLVKVFKKLGFQISKKEIQDIIACRPNVIENLLKKVYKNIQKYSANDETSENINKNNQSAENFKYDNNNENLNIDKTNPSFKDKNLNYGDISDPRIKNMLDEKDMRIEELKNIIDVYFFFIFL
jgi:hypothetical protein